MLCVRLAALPQEARRLRIAYYGARKTNVTDDYLSVLKNSGVTDVWISYLQGAFAVDCCKKNASAYRAGGLYAGLMSLAAVKAANLTMRYRSHDIRPWFFERPVPDFEYTTLNGAIGPNLFNSSSESVEAGWAQVVENITRVYPKVRSMGFEGLVYDNEGYYSKTCQDPVTNLPVSCLWAQREAYLNATGAAAGGYYRRGKQVGDAIAAVWPGATVQMVYGLNYTGLIEWIQGHVDAGLKVKVGTEHTYGAGPCSGPYYTGQWFQCDFGGPPGVQIPNAHHLNQTLAYEYNSWPPATGE